MTRSGPTGGAGGREELLYQNARTRVVRVHRPDGAGAVICKDLLGPDAPMRARHETAILERLVGIEGVPQLTQGESVANAIVTVDPDGLALAGSIPPEGFSATVVMDLALAVAGIVARVHCRGVMHKDINPANILLCGAMRTPMLIDFDTANTFAEERPSFTHQSELSGTLAYLAPEQTGRTGRPVDQRVDLYALGATLYELATGQVPFVSPDPLTVIHEHLARTPKPPIQLNPAVPQMLSDIILRLLEKEPDQRYQSADGLVYDLSALLDHEKNGHERPFVLRKRDFPLRLSPPSRLVGRDREIGQLRTAFEGVRGSQARGVLVAGSPGVGKTSLIDELRPMVTVHGGWFITGKFDQNRQDITADAIWQALRALGRLLLAEPEEELAILRVRLLDILGPNAGICASLPEFALLLDVAVQMPTGDTAQGEARMRQTAVDLLRAVATPTRPVVMVLDDLQWATELPMATIDDIFTDREMSDVLLVGAYREAEIDAVHPLSAMITRWERLGVAPAMVRLTNLPPADLATLLAQMLRLPLQDATALAAAIGTRTSGNPYDTVELVNALRRDGVLAPGGDGWSWDATTIRRYIGRGEVTDLIATRIKGLPTATQALLEILAFLGGEVDLSLLRAASDLSEPDLEHRLMPGLEEGLLVTVQVGGIDAAVRFRHDRVQETVHGRLDGSRRRRLHLMLARRLAALPEYVAVAAQQYLPAVEGLDDAEERGRVVILFGAAAADLRLANGVMAERFLEAAVELLSPEEDAVDDALRTRLESERHAALCNLGRLDEADKIYARIARRCTEPLDLAPVASLQIGSHTNRGQLGEALRLGLDLLRQLGLDIPVEDFEADTTGHLDDFYQWVHDTERADYVERPQTDDRRIQTAAGLINRLLPTAFFYDPMINYWLMLASQRLWAEHGPCAAMVANLSPAICTTVALRQDYRTGYTAVRHALAVGEAAAYEPQTSFARFLNALLAMHWFEPLEGSIEQTRLAREGLLRLGDLQSACLTYTASIIALLDCAQTLEDIDREVESGLAFAARTGNAYVTGTYLAHRQLLRALRGDTDAPGNFTDVSFDETAHLLTANPGSAVAFHVNRALSAAVFGDDAGLARHASAAMALLAAVEAYYLVAAAHLLQALALARRAQAAEPAERAGIVLELDACRDWLAARAMDAPTNFSHLRQWVEAERAWAMDDAVGAARAFDAAMEEVSARQRPWHQALMTERAAQFHLDHGLNHTGRVLLGEATALYRAWGATAKVASNKEKYPFLRDLDGGQQTWNPRGTISVSGDAMDLMAALKASQVLSSETNLDQLRSRVVEVLTAMTGATSVRLLLWNPDAQAWSLPATAGEPEAMDGETTISVDEAGRQGLICLSAFRYAERTRQPLLVPDATSDDRFSRDPYLNGLEACSLLVVPILSRGEPRAMVLMENRLSRGNFTTERLDAVLLIAGQLAICLDNALAERFRSLVQRSSDLTLVCDRGGTVSYASAASTEILAVTDTDLVGHRLLDLIHPDDREAFTAWIAHEGPTGQMLECRVQPAATRARWAEVSCTDLTGDPAVAALVLHLRDVTERHHLETELRHAQKLESVGQLAAGVAHEINTPIQFIADNLRFIAQSLAPITTLLDGYRQALTSSSLTGDLATRHQALLTQEHDIDLGFLRHEIPTAAEQALDGTQRVARIVRAMKAFAHPGGDGKSPADLNEAIRNTLIVADSEIKFVADVILDLADDLPAVLCNLGDINQVILNLVINAAHAITDIVTKDSHPTGRGTLTIRTRAEPGTVVIEIQDTGTGIPDHIADRVFDQFFTTKSVGVGTGQGLALVHTLIHDRHHGTITFVTEPGIGTTFTIRLPNPPAEAA